MLDKDEVSSPLKATVHLGMGAVGRVRGNRGKWVVSTAWERWTLRQ